MAGRKLYVLDVGHGNCTLLQDDKGIVVIDAGPGSALKEFLLAEGLDRVDVVLLSHSDQDHIEGLIALLECIEIKIGIVRYNPDGSKNSILWDDLTFMLNDSSRRGEIDCKTTLTTTDSSLFNQGNINIEILAPNTYIAGKSPGSIDRKGRRLTSNSNSAVIRLVLDGRPLVLIPGDIDTIGFDNMLEDGVNCEAPIVIFPHHGGNPGAGNLKAFVERFCEQTKPSIFIFSLDREKHHNPKPDLINLIRQKLPSARIVCTQLSMHCSSQLPVFKPKHLTDKYAKGKHQNKCCAGTIEINLDESFTNIERTILPNLDLHKDFVELSASSSLCLKKTASTGE